MKVGILVLVALLAIGVIVGGMYVDRKYQMVTKNETIKSNRSFEQIYPDASPIIPFHPSEDRQTESKPEPTIHYLP